MSSHDESTLYEIVELDNGEVALRRADEGSEPLVSIRFSHESLFFLDNAKFEVAKAMIEAGLDAVADMSEGEEDEDEEGEAPSREGQVLH